ncbi:MAG: hypothetical protein FK733_14850 [Asgard group archaeon]|nr:hypothetical protein [Asgard group archaeon]
MKIKNYKCYNAKKEFEIEPNEWMQGHFGRLDLGLKYLTEFKPNFIEKYIQHLKKRIENALNIIKKKEGFYDFPAKEEKYEFLDKYPELRELTRVFFLTHLNPLKKSTKDPKKYIVYGLNESKAFRRISYHRVKSFVEMLGKEDGIELHTKILSAMIKELTKKYPQQDDIKILESREKAHKSWCGIGMADFTYCILDDQSVVYRFDSCFAHEALKDFNDPDIAYYASCYGADLPAFNEGRIIHLRRTRTLHHYDYCDEFYWDSREFKEPPEQPSIEFIEKMGKEETK